MVYQWNLDRMREETVFIVVVVGGGSFSVVGIGVVCINVLL